MTYVISFPCSGRHWLTYMIACYINPEQHYPMKRQFNKKLRKSKKWPKCMHDNAKRPSIEEVIRRRKTIIIVRQPEDCLVSYYYHQKKHNNLPPRMGISSFIRSRSGLPRWNKFIKTINTLKKKNILIINYEDVKRNVHKEFERMFDFLGFEYTEEQKRYIINRSSFDSMKEMEKNYYISQGIDISDNNIFKTRTGKIGKNKKELKPKDLQYIKKYKLSLD